MITDRGRKRKRFDRRQSFAPLLFTALMLVIISSALIALDLTGMDRDLKMNPTPEPSSEFVRDNTPLPRPGTDEEIEIAPTAQPEVPTDININGQYVLTLESKQSANKLLSDVMRFYESLTGEKGLTSEFNCNVELKETAEDSLVTDYNTAFELLTGENSPLKIVSKLSKYETETITHSVQYLESDEFYVGTKFVVSYGCDGKNRRCTEYTYINGILDSCIQTEKRTICSPVMQVVIVGSREIPDDGVSQPDFDADNLPSYEAAFRFPVDKRTCPIVKYYGFYGGELHLGIDFECSVKTPCKTVLAGKVISIMERGSYGLCVDIRHSNGLISRYAGLSIVNVEVGDELSISEQIGIINDAELHFELILNDRNVNPLVYLQMS